MVEKLLSRSLILKTVKLRFELKMKKKNYQTKKSKKGKKKCNKEKNFCFVFFKPIKQINKLF